MSTPAAERREDIGASDYVGEATRLRILLRIDSLPAIHLRLAALIDHTLDIGDGKIFRASRRASPAALRQAMAAAPARKVTTFDLREILAGEYHRIWHRRPTMIAVPFAESSFGKDGDVHCAP